MKGQETGKLLVFLNGWLSETLGKQFEQGG